MRTLLRVLLAGAALGVAMVLELVVAPCFGLPEATPDLVLLVVLAFATAWGPAGAAGCGFAGGLLLDLAPPDVGPLGTHAFTFTVIGALYCRFSRVARDSALATSLFAGGCAAAAALFDVALGALLGDGAGLSGAGLVAALAATTLYTAVAAPLVLPGVMALARRVAGPRARLLAPCGFALAETVTIRAAKSAPGLHTLDRS